MRLAARTAASHRVQSCPVLTALRCSPHGPGAWNTDGGRIPGGRVFAALRAAGGMMLAPASLPVRGPGGGRGRVERGQATLQFPSRARDGPAPARKPTGRATIR